MLYYCSIHPDWDCFGEFALTEKRVTISELLESISGNQPRLTGQCFSKLERLGVFLGNGAFETLLIQRDPADSLGAADRDWVRTVIDGALSCLEVSLWYCFSIQGNLYILCCFPRLTENDPRVQDHIRSTFQSCQRLQETLSPGNPALRIILSDMEYGEIGVFRTFNNLMHAKEYYDFSPEPSSLIQINANHQLHDAFIGSLSEYRHLSVTLAEQLSRPDTAPEELAARICDTILQNSVSSMESVHHHIQIFMLTFTDYLGSAGVVDASYMSRRQITYRAMGFEREVEFRQVMSELIQELQHQNQTLRKIGRQKRIQSIREYVEEHITDPALSASQISDIFQVGTAQIAKQFRYYYGVSLHRFIQQARFQHAQQLLADHGDWSMQRISIEAGYTDLSTMYRTFRALGNVTPGALRDSLRQDHPLDENEAR